MKSNARLLLIGYSGKRNFGDDLLLKQACSAFTGYAEIHIYSPNMDQGADYLYSWFPGAVIQKRVQLDNNFLKNYTHILYFGGGIFFDYKKKIDLLHYLKKRISVFKNYKWVRLRGTHFAGIGIGLGPFIDKKSADLCVRKLKNFDYLNVRDSVSLAFCKNHHYSKATICEDLSLTVYQYFHSFKISRGSRAKRVIVCPRKFPHGENKDKYLENLLILCEEFRSEGKDVFIYGFQSGHDEVVISEFSKKGFKTGIWNPDLMEIEDLLKEFANCELIITARMHGLYVAGMLDVPVIGISVHQKLKLASKFFSKSLFVPDIFEPVEIRECIQKLNDLPENDFDLLCQKENQCKEQYEIIKRWLGKNKI